MRSLDSFHQGTAQRRPAPAMGVQVMGRARSHGWLAGTLMVAAALLAASQPVAAQAGGSGDAVKATSLLNVARFAQWPALPARATLVVCVVGNVPIAESLAGITRGKDIGGRNVNVVQPGQPASWADCHMLFIAAAQVPASAAALGSIRTLPVLTVSDSTGFSRAGGVIELHPDGGRMRFSINVDAVERTGLRLSSRLLGLATVIRDP